MPAACKKFQQSQLGNRTQRKNFQMEVSVRVSENHNILLATLRNMQKVQTISARVKTVIVQQLARYLKAF